MLSVTQTEPCGQSDELAQSIPQNALNCAMTLVTQTSPGPQPATEASMGLDGLPQADAPSLPPQPSPQASDTLEAASGRVAGPIPSPSMATAPSLLIKGTAESLPQLHRATQRNPYRGFMGT